MRWFVPSCLLLALLSSPGATAALDDSGVETIGADEFWMYPVEIFEENGGVDEAVPLTVTTEHQEGPAINFFVLDETNFNLFEEGEDFSVIQGERNLGITGEHTTTVALNDLGIYYLIWDNWDYGLEAETPGPTTFSYTVTSTDVHEAPGLGALFVIVAFIGMAAWRRHSA